MKRLRLLGLMLIAVFALGAVASTSASAAEEPGLLTLTEVLTLKVEQERAEPQANVVKVGAGGIGIDCKKLWVLPGTLTPGLKHWNFIKDADLHLTECVMSGTLTKCKSPNDANGTILILEDVHWVAWLEGMILVAGETFLLLNEKLESGSIVLTCGVMKLELKGSVPAEAAQLNEEGKEIKEGESKRFDVTAKPGFKCDMSDVLCSKLYEPNLLLVNFGKEWEAAEETSETQQLIATSVVKWDF